MRTMSLFGGSFFLLKKLEHDVIDGYTTISESDPRDGSTAPQIRHPSNAKPKQAGAQKSKKKANTAACNSAGADVLQRGHAFESIPSFAPVKSKSLYEKAFFVYGSKRRDGSGRIVLFYLRAIKDKIQNEMDCACT